MADMLMDVQPLDLSCPAGGKFWLAADHHSAASTATGGVDLTTATKMATAAAAYAKLSVAIPPRRYSNCSDNVSFADSSDRSPSISPAASSGGDRFRQPYHHHHHLSDSELSSSLGSDSDGDRVPSPLAARGDSLATRGGPATKRFLSKYIKEQVGKFLIIFFHFLRFSILYDHLLICLQIC